MLIAHVERYLSLRQMLGYKLRDTSANLRAFAKFATRRGDNHVRISTAMDRATEGISPYNRHIRLRATAQLARFLHAEDPAHRGTIQSVSCTQVAASALHLHTGGDCAASRSDQSPSPVVPAATPSLRNDDVLDGLWVGLVRQRV